MTLSTDLNSPIIPGRSAAGLNLGISLDDVNPVALQSLNWSKESHIINDKQTHWDEYSSPDLYLRFIDGVLSTIGVMGKYQGKIMQGLGIGDKVDLFEHVFGNLMEGDEDELTFERVQNQLWIEVNEMENISGNWLIEVKKRFVTGIFIII